MLSTINYKNSFIAHSANRILFISNDSNFAKLISKFKNYFGVNDSICIKFQIYHCDFGEIFEIFKVIFPHINLEYSM